MISTDLPVLNLTTSSQSYGISGVVQEWASAGFFGRINYDYAGRYLVEGNLPTTVPPASAVVTAGF